MLAPWNAIPQRILLQRKESSMNISRHGDIVKGYLCFKGFHKTLEEWKLERTRLQRGAYMGNQKLINRAPIEAAAISCKQPLVSTQTGWGGSAEVPGQHQTLPRGLLQRLTQGQQAAQPALLTACSGWGPWPLSGTASGTHASCNAKHVLTSHRRLCQLSRISLDLQ